MARRTVSSTLAALGLDDQEERLYQRMLPLSGSTLAEVAVALDCGPDEVLDGLDPLLDRVIAQVEGVRVVVRSLAAVVTSYLEREAEELFAIHVVASTYLARSRPTATWFPTIAKSPRT